jgi:integrase/recombinase XerD
MSLFIKNRETLLRLHEGPLGPYIDDYAAELQEEGYAQHSAELRIGLVADFNQWLAKRRIPAPQITTAHFHPYLRFRARYRPPQRGAPAALKRLLDLLLRQGVIPEPSLPPATPAEKLRDEFCLYLRQERALSSATLIAYRPFVGEFLTGRFGTGPVNLASLSAADVIGFVQRRAASIHSKQVQLLTTALRSFLRFAHYRGNVHADLAACVPSVANWSQSNIPKAFPSGQVRHVLAACNRRTAVGRRDYAILLLLARLGLRAGEIRTLTLEDLDWPAGLITVRGKGGHDSPMPLPLEVGEAIAGYLRKGRPPTASRCLFLRARAPVQSFKGSQAIDSVVRHALARAGIDSPRKGAHQFRHGLACQMLRQGASLAEIGEVLRHRSPQTTAIYAKVDLPALRSLALPWPGGGR